MNKLVTIGIPIYRRLQYLPSLLGLIEAQDYPDLELIVSDNGRNGTKVEELVRAHYSRRFRVRQNAETVSMAKHWNQILHEAAGEYFVMLADDDEISGNYVSELVTQLVRHPQAAVAISAQELMDREGVTLRQRKENLPELLSGEEFIVTAWQKYTLGIGCFATLMSRTADIKACGGYVDFPRGNHMDDALLIRLCLNRSVAFSDKCVFRNRYDLTSEGWSASLRELAVATREFLEFLDRDRITQQFAAEKPMVWQELRAILVEMAWQTYLERWQGMYRHRASYLEWLKAAFALPFIGAYYKNAGLVMARSIPATVLGAARRSRAAYTGRLAPTP